MRKKTGLWWLWVTILVLVVDRLTKLLALKYLIPYSPLQILPIFNLTLAYNKGAAFGFLNNASGWQGWFFGSISVLVSIAILIWLSRLSSTQRVLSIALTLVVGGALGNLSDRLHYGYVIDFLDFHLGAWHFATFNIADSAICIGAFLLFLDALRAK